ncbi:MAG: class I SAM-dependent methyltransferase [Myxococcota bacterium]
MNWLRQQWYERSLRQMLAGFARTHLLRAGIGLELFEALRVPRTANQLARDYRLAPDLLQAWLRAAEAHGLICVVRGRERTYQVCGLARWLLESAQSESLTSLVDSAIESHGPVFERMPGMLRGGERPDFGGSAQAQRAAQAARLVEPQALEALARIPGARAAKRVLDIGCGYGTYLTGLLLRYRDAYGLGIERDPAVASIASRNIQDADLVRRAEIRVGDFMSVEIDAGLFDLIMLNNNLYYFAPSTREGLFERVRSRLAEGGVFAIQIPFVSDRLGARISGLTATTAVFDLFLRSHNNLYGLPDLAEVHASLAAVGFSTVGEAAFLHGGAARYVWAKKTG